MLMDEVDRCAAVAFVSLMVGGVGGEPTKCDGSFHDVLWGSPLFGGQRAVSLTPLPRKP